MFPNEEVFSSSLAHGAVGSVGCSSPLGVALHSGTARSFCFSAIPLHDVGSFALNGAFCGWPGRGERLLRAKLFWGGAGARNQVQSRAEYRCTLLSSSASSQRDLAAPL